MHIAAATHLACPMDGTRLRAIGAALQCDRGHSFDRAKEGYWNLLLVQHKASRDPGDSREMVAARRRILQAGHYAPIADAVFAVVRTVVAERPAESALRILDAGCGEGFYLAHIAEAAAAGADPARLELAGIDISKWAVRLAAKRKAPVTWAVATNRHLPFAAGSVGLILCLFGFPVWDGFKPVQAAGGRVLLVDPGPDHLIELRSVIYPGVKRSGLPSIAAAEAAGYRLEREQTLRCTIALDTPARIADLLAMTPHAHRIGEPGRAALAGLDRLDATIDVALRLLRLDAA